MTIYLAGPMTGMPKENRPAFWQAAEDLTGKGFKVFNPGCLPYGLPNEVYMPICLAMLEAADVMVLMPGWQKSKGVALEKMYAEHQGKRVVDLEWILGKCSTEWD